MSAWHEQGLRLSKRNIESKQVACYYALVFFDQIRRGTQFDPTIITIRKKYWHPMSKVTLKNRLMTFAAIALSSLVLFAPELWAQCSLDIQKNITSGWHKKNVSYTTEANIIKVKVGKSDWDDSDSIYIGSMKGCGVLTVAVTQIYGEYPWDGKAFGISFANEKRKPHQWGNFASFPPPRGYKIDDGFIKAWLSNHTRLVYDIPDSSQTSHIGAKIFLGSHNGLELEFNAYESPHGLQLAWERRSYLPGHNAINTNYQSDRPVASCATNCDEPRPGHRQSVISRFFSRLSDIACRN